jgi:hypothetical protein
MKKISTSILTCFALVSALQAQSSFDDDFESYTVGNLVGATSPVWRTWSGQVAAEDVAVVNNDNNTAAGSKSLYLSSTATGGGPQDLVLPFGGIQTSGIFTFSTWFKVPTGKAAYFNFQGNATIGGLYALDCYMDDNGTLRILNGALTKVTSTYPQAAWFELKIVANLTVNSWEVFVNGVSKGSFASVANAVSFVDYYPATVNSQFWMDDVHYDVAPYTLPAVNGSLNAISINSGLAGQTRTPIVTVKNAGVQPITSFDLTFVNNGTPSTQTVSGVNIASLAAYNVTMPSITLVSGTANYSASVSNVNGAGVDGTPSDDTNNISVSSITPAPGRMVVAEEATGTWCQWCPRGAVFMDLLAERYKGYFAGIAVHNGNNDPMKNTAYDASVSALVGGYPSALVDRGTDVDPSVIEPDFIQRIVIAPKATFVNGAIFNSTTRELKISLTATMQSAITGNYKVACVLTEDSVSGLTPGYAQSNAYAGGAAGVMGGFELLPSPVPASLMNYNHVGREIIPSFAGFPNAYGASAPAGQVTTHTFTYVLPASWDPSQIHIVGLFIAPDGKIDNASQTSISEAVTNGFVAGTEVLGVPQLTNQVDAAVSLYPNPSQNKSNVALNLEKAANVEVSILQMNGALVAKKSYGQLSGSSLLPIDMTNLNVGMYFVNVNVDGKITALKLIKE